MLKKIASLFSSSSDMTAADLDAPHYPPLPKGIPAVRESTLLKPHVELIKQIHQAVMFKRSDFDALVLPVLQRYAAFVHLLPASEAHHHRGEGGLLHHGLEVAFLATRSSEDVVFGAREVPQRRLALEPRWRLAVCMAALTHDIGKVVTDVSVTDSTGKHRWDCCSQSIADWSARHKIDRYFLSWHPDRQSEHEMMSALVLDRVLTTEIRTYLGSMGPEIMQAMMSAVLHRTSDPGHIARLVRHADSASVERDMRRQPTPGNVSHGVPVERYLLDAMRRLVKSGQWKVNEKGARLWMLNGDLHIVWHAAVEDVTKLLSQDKVPGVPRDPDAMADVLIDRALASPRETHSTTYRYWRMCSVSFTGATPQSLLMLRLSSPQLLLDVEPLSIPAQVMDTLAGGETEQSGAETIARVDDAAVPEPHLASPAIMERPTRSRFDAGHADLLLERIFAEGEWGKHLFEHNGQVVIAYPEGAALAAQPAEVQRLLGDEGIVVPDPMSSLVIVRFFNGRKGIMLTPRISALILDRHGRETTVLSQEAQETRAQEQEALTVEAIQAGQGKSDQNAAWPDDSQVPKNRGRRKRGKKKPSMSDQAAVVAHGAVQSSTNEPLDRCVAALLATVREGTGRIGQPCKVEGDWIRVPQYLVGHAASEFGDAQVMTTELRGALLKHPDVEVRDPKSLSVRAIPTD
ncbi:Conjugative transfer protein TraI, relaxase [Salinisphaera dokdonensis CL-ES53]|uniref:Conjugative transfer protein TraI, relaxase n=1 Tax=Salinisphaera dokdonensis CL-ES53 TaxID=1304272 RepID=A0ABV2B2X4_9GAMM